MRPRVNTEKHILQFSPTTVGLGAISNVLAVHAVAAPALSRDVREGAIVSAIYVEFWIHSDDAAAGSTVVTLEKVPALATPMTYAQSIVLNDYSNKKNILYTSQGLVPPNVQSGLPLIRGWFKIPKGKQRFGLGDKIIINISGISNGVVYCGHLQFKEQF